MRRGSCSAAASGATRSCGAARRAVPGSRGAPSASTSASRTSSRPAPTSFLMPSRFEPCGLNQMNSLRYGTLPIVRATGGLDDTVQADLRRTGHGTGFQFQRLHARGAGRRGPAGAGRVSRRPNVARLQRAACGRTSPGTSRPGSMSKCIECAIPEDINDIWLLKTSRP